MDQVLTRARTKGLCALAVGVLLLPLAACSSSSSSPTGASSDAGGGNDQPLVVASWGGDFTAATKKYLTDPFTKDTGIPVTIVDAPGTQVAGLQAQKQSGKSQWDLLDSADASDSFFLYKNGLLEKLPDDVHSKLESQVSEGSLSDFGFTFGALGFVVICNMDKVKACPPDVKSFFDTAKYPGSREMYAGSSQTITVGEVANGVTDTANTPVDLDQVMDTLRQIKPEVRLWYTGGQQMEDALRNGEVDMAIGQSGRAYRLKNSGMNVQINWDGGVFDPGYWSVVAGSSQKDNANKLLEWIAAHPEAQAGWADTMGYSVPSPDALKLMKPETAEQMAQNPVNFAKLNSQNFPWMVDNADQVKSTWQEFIGG